MKKISKLLIATLLACSMLLVVVGCGENTIITKLEWGTMPATEYTMDATKDEAASKALLKFAIKLTTETDKVETIFNATEADTSITVGTVNMPIVISGFNVATEGTRTASVKIGSFSLTFEYTVTNPASDEVKGKGTAAEPYLISNALQFAKIIELDMANTAPAVQMHYKITSDIDLLNLPDTYKTTITTKTDGKYPIFKGKIDGGCYNGKEYTGKNWKLLNYKSEAPKDMRGTKMQPGLFFRLGNCTFENIDLVNFKMDNASAAGAGFFGAGNYDTGSDKAGFIEPMLVSKTEKLTYNFKNINVVNAYMNTDKNSGVFVGYTYYNTDVNVHNCTIDKDTLLVGSREIGGFVGSNCGKNKELVNTYTFTNCKNAAVMSAKNPGALLANNSNMAVNQGYTSNVNISDCKFTGTMYRTEKYTTPDTIKVANIFTSNPWMGHYPIPEKATITSSSCVGAKFEDMIGSGTNYNHTLFEIAGIDTTTNIKFNKVANAIRYVVNYSFDINGSRYVVAEELTTDKNGVLTTTFGKPTKIWTAKEADAQNPKVTESLATGIIVLNPDFTTEIIKVPTVTVQKQDIKYSIIAYNAEDLPIAANNGIYVEKLTIWTV